MRLTKCLAIDCEMVGTGPRGKYEMLARVSLVNEYGECIYDVYVKPTAKVTTYRTWVSGITKEDLQNGYDFDEVREDVRRMIRRRVLVGHSIKHDLDVLNLTHPEWRIRDTSRYPPFIQMNCNRIPSLKWLARVILGEEIQQGWHSSEQDARAAMDIYKSVEDEWEHLLRYGH